MNKVKEFIQASYEEMKDRVTWPTGAELRNNTVLVLVASLLFALLIGGVDFVFKLLMQTIYESL